MFSIASPFSYFNLFRQCAECQYDVYLEILDSDSRCPSCGELIPDSKSLKRYLMDKGILQGIRFQLLGEDQN